MHTHTFSDPNPGHSQRGWQVSPWSLHHPALGSSAELTFPQSLNRLSITWSLRQRMVVISDAKGLGSRLLHRTTRHHRARVKASHDKRYRSTLMLFQISQSCEYRPATTPIARTSIGSTLDVLCPWAQAPPLRYGNDNLHSSHPLAEPEDLVQATTPTSRHVATCTSDPRNREHPLYLLLNTARKK
jgi:hypothetical protein